MASMKGSIAKELSVKISDLIGYHFGEEHIHDIGPSGEGYYYYIQSLKPGYPVLAMHYRGPLMLVLPFADFQRLQSEEVSVDEYISNSHFNYGYYWGGGSAIGGGYWQPLEAEAGIHDTARISRYLHILSCRTHKQSSGYGPTIEGCRNCQLDATACPYSPLNQSGTWENEVREPDRRRELFAVIGEMIESELGLKLVSRMPHDGDSQELLLCPGWEPDTVTAYISKNLWNDLLYHPEVERDWEQMVQGFTLSVIRPYRPDSKTQVPKDAADKQAFCLDFWREEVAAWEQYRTDTDAEPEENTTAASPSTTKAKGPFACIAKIFRQRVAKR